MRRYISAPILILLLGGMAQASIDERLSPWHFDRSPAMVNSSAVALPYGYRPGYTDNVDDEVSSEPQEMLLLEKPAILNVPDFHDKIFNAELSNEFLSKYQQTFGQTEQEENYFLINRQGYYMSVGGLTATQEDSARRAFAEYMAKRLLEFHGENVMKSDPQLRKVYEIKQAISNVNVTVGPSTHVDMAYGFVGNAFSASVSHPLVTGVAIVQMDPSSLVPTAPKEITVSARRSVTKKISGDLSYWIYGQMLRLGLAEPITATISANFSQSVHVAGIEFDPSRESLTLVGMNLTF